MTGWDIQLAAPEREARIDDLEVDELLTALIDKSLVLFDCESGRYDLLESVRDFGRAKLTDAGASESLRFRHLEYFVDLVEDAEQSFCGAGEQQRMLQLDSENENLRAALQWSHETEGGGEAGLRLAGGLWHFWEIRGHYSEGKQWLTTALDGTLGADAAIRAKGFTGAGGMAWLLGDYRQAAQWHEKAVGLYRQVEDNRGLAFALNNVGVQVGNLGDYSRAKELFEESLNIAKDIGDKSLIGLQLNNLAEMARYRADYTRARMLYEESLVASREAGDKQRLGETLYNYATMMLKQGEHDKARMLYEEALDASSELGERRVMALCLGGLGGAWVVEGHPANAAQLLGAAEAFRNTTGHRLQPEDRQDYEENLEACRAALSGDEFSASFSAGQKLTLEEAVDYALTKAK